MERETVVVGAGLMGAATAWAIARRGRPVVLLEQFAAGHGLGSSHGSARIVRRAYGDALYTRLTGRTFELWRELESTSGAELLRLLGGLDFGDARGVDDVADHLAVEGVPHEVLPAAEAEARWPGLRFEGDVVFHPQAGTVDAAGAVEAMVAAAGAAGAEIRYGVEVTGIDRSGDGALVRTADGTELAAASVVVAAGAWVGPLLAGVVDVPPLRVTQEQIFHFPRHDPAAPAWPSVIHEGRGHAVYHLAGGRDGGSGDDRKIGEHTGGTPTTATTRSGTVDPASRERVVEYVRRWLPGLDPTPRSEATCLYTRTANEDFLLDRAGAVVVCSPCSGHGAKFAPLIGEYAAALALDGAGDLPERFRLAAHASGAAGSVSL